MKTLHKWLGIFMLLPFISWSITGFFFYFKPGYKDAYASISIKSYPITHLPSIVPLADWTEVRWINSVLGLHLFAKKHDKWEQFDPITLKASLPLDENQVKTLVVDAISGSDRYGEIKTVEIQPNDTAIIETSTERIITLKWPSLSLSQSGPDTDFINTMYKIHYLEWTGYKPLDRVLGSIGLVLVLILAVFGLVLSFKPKHSNNKI